MPSMSGSSVREGEAEMADSMMAFGRVMLPSERASL